MLSQVWWHVKQTRACWWLLLTAADGAGEVGRVGCKGREVLVVVCLRASGRCFLLF